MFTDCLSGIKGWPMNTSKLDTLTQKRDEINEQIKKIKTQESIKRRKEDTKRKILIGGVVIKMLKTGEMPQDRLTHLLDKHLEKQTDRDLFELPERNQSEQEEKILKRELIGA